VRKEEVTDLKEDFGWESVVSVSSMSVSNLLLPEHLFRNDCEELKGNPASLFPIILLILKGILPAYSIITLILETLWESGIKVYIND